MTHPEVYIHTTECTVSVFPPGHPLRKAFQLSLRRHEHLGQDKWSVMNGPYHLNKDGSFEHDNEAASKKEWLATYFFDLETARKMAIKAAPGLVVMGRKASDLLGEHQCDE